MAKTNLEQDPKKAKAKRPQMDTEEGMKAGVASARVPMYAGPHMTPGNKRVQMKPGRKPKH